MAEKKQYLNQQLEKGTLLISEVVLETIVFNAVKDVEGIAGFSARPTQDVLEAISKRNGGKSLDIRITESGHLEVWCNLKVRYGYNIGSVAKTLQSAIYDALTSAANATVIAVNVNISEIVCM